MKKEHKGEKPMKLAACESNAGFLLAGLSSAGTCHIEFVIPQACAPVDDDSPCSTHRPSRSAMCTGLGRTQFAPCPLK